MQRHHIVTSGDSRGMQVNLTPSPAGAGVGYSVCRTEFARNGKSKSRNLTFNMMNGGPATGHGLIVGNVQWSVGQTQFAKSLILSTPTNPDAGVQRMHLPGCDQAEFSAAWIGNQFNATDAPLPIRAAIAEGAAGMSTQEFFSPMWNPTLVPSLLKSQVVLDIATMNANMPAFFAPMKPAVLGLLCNTTAAAEVVWLMLFDTNVAPVNGAHPIMRSVPMGTTFPAYTSLDQSDPALSFSTGIAWALSTTADVLTLPGDAATAIVDVKIGF